MSPESTSNEDRALSGLVHLQAAALELIAATRAFLDVAEDLVRDPAASAALVRTAAGMVAALRPDASPPADAPADTGVRRIRLS